VTFAPGSTQLTVYYNVNQPPPPIVRGRWVMDGTPYANYDKSQPLHHANFYRVSSVTAADGTMYIDLETPIRPRSDGVAGGYGGDLIILNGVAEVFERPALITGNTP